MLISEPVFFAATPASFVSFLEAQVPDPQTKAPNPERIGEHARRFPDSKAQPALLMSHAAPASYATTPYFSNHAFKLVAASGSGTWVRFSMDPAAGTVRLTEEQEKTLRTNPISTGCSKRMAAGGSTR